MVLALHLVASPFGICWEASLLQVLHDNNDEGRQEAFCQLDLMQSMQEFLCGERSNEVAPVWNGQEARLH